jgi:hypothetical protein
MGPRTTYMREFLANRYAQGLCVRCGLKPHLPDKRTCGCDLEYLKLRKEKMASTGCCQRCWAPLNALDTPGLHCATCHEIIRQREARRSQRKIDVGLCKQCGHNPPLEGQKWCAECCRKAREYAQKVQREVFAAYGNVCSCCGESKPEFLSIDHIDGGGTAHRKRISNIYTWLRANKFPSGYRILCFNCNCGRERNGGVCPHVATREDQQA